jgi:hypothetical protein
MPLTEKEATAMVTAWCAPRRHLLPLVHHDFETHLKMTLAECMVLLVEAKALDQASTVECVLGGPAHGRCVNMLRRQTSVVGLL